MKTILSILLILFAFPVLAGELNVPEEEMLVEKPVEEINTEKEESTLSLDDVKKAKYQKNFIAEQVEKMKNEEFLTELANKYRKAMIRFISYLNSLADGHPEDSLKIRDLAIEQSELEKNIGKILDDLEQKDKTRKFFFGTNFSQTKEAKEHINQTKKKLGDLGVIKEQMMDLSDRKAVGFEVVRVAKVLDEIEKKIKDEEDKFSLFGWIKKIFI